MKTFLERRLKQQEEEVGYLKSFLGVVDTLLAERSFRPVDIGSATPTPPSKPQPTERTPSDNVPIMTTDGVRIASITIQANDLRVLPEPGINLDSNSPPLRSFLLAKVLEPMQSKDKEAERRQVLYNQTTCSLMMLSKRKVASSPFMYRTMETTAGCWN